VFGAFLVVGAVVLLVLRYKSSSHERI
jgi:hypothetical protein